jgi:methylmalonyl-CoA/ethylmalonyl-CoA epimerase
VTLHGPETLIRRLDHVAVAVRDTGTALEHFSGRLGLEIVHTEELEQPHVRLTYLDVGNAFIQLVEPLDDENELAQHLATSGEGIHHICFAVDNVLASARELGMDGDQPVAGSGRGRLAAFVPGPSVHGVKIECTQFDHATDVLAKRGWIENAPGA